MPPATRTSLRENFPAPTASHIDDAVGRLLESFSPVKIIVFGSVVRDRAQAGSDLDFLVVLPQVDNKREAAIAMRRSLSGLGVPVDVFVTTEQEIERRGWIKGTVLRAALEEGSVVYSASGAA